MQGDLNTTFDLEKLDENEGAGTSIFHYIQLYRGMRGNKGDVIGSAFRAEAAKTEFLTDHLLKLKMGRMPAKEFVQYVSSRSADEYAMVRALSSLRSAGMLGSAAVYMTLD